MSRQAIPMLGRKFGLLTVTAFAGRDRFRQPLFDCRCDCGAEVTRSGYTLRHAVKIGNTPNCGRHRRAKSKGERTSLARKGKVTIANYRRIAKEFTAEQVARLAEILRRHPKASCGYCSRTPPRACHVAAEAVEAVVLEDAYGLRREGVERFHQIDYRKAGMYTL